MRMVPFVRPGAAKICRDLETLGKTFPEVVFISARATPRLHDEEEGDFRVVVGVIGNEKAVRLGYGMMISRAPGMSKRGIRARLFPLVLAKKIHVDIIRGKKLEWHKSSELGHIARAVAAVRRFGQWLFRAAKSAVTSALGVRRSSSSRS
jgi:hypothetical protein